MGFKLGRNKVRRYPKYEEYDCQDLIEQVKDTIDKLVEYQKKLVIALQQQKKQLCVSYEDLKNEQAQLSFLHFLNLCSLYGAAKKLSKFINLQYNLLIKYCEENDENGVEDCKSSLQTILDYVLKFPFEDVMNDQVTGLLRLTVFVDSFKVKVDLPVIHIPAVNWSFRDIIGTIQNHGLLDECLWKHTVSFSVPDNPSIPCPDQ